MRSRIGRRLLGVALASTLLAGCRADAGAGDAARPGAIVPVDERITLVNHRGERWTIASGAGRIRIVFFGYTMCADACPIAMSRIAQASRLLADPSRFDAIFVSVDRQRDTPAVLAEYVSAFSFPLTGLTGAKEAIDALAADFGVRYEIEPSDSAAGYLVSHTTTLFLVDGLGRIRHRYASSATPVQIAAGVQQLLQETP